MGSVQPKVEPEPCGRRIAWLEKLEKVSHAPKGGCRRRVRVVCGCRDLVRVGERLGAAARLPRPGAASGWTTAQSFGGTDVELTRAGIAADGTSAVAWRRTDARS
jgi:hypothetical protein